MGRGGGGGRTRVDSDRGFLRWMGVWSYGIEVWDLKRIHRYAGAGGLRERGEGGWMDVSIREGRKVLGDE